MKKSHKTKGKVKSKKSNIVSIDSEQLEHIRMKNGKKFANELKEMEERKRKKKVIEKRIRKINEEGKSLYKVIYTGMRN